MSTGAHNMQMYWVSTGQGRQLVAFPFSWSTEAQTWVPNEATLLRPREPYVVYGWNEVCIKCHSVGGEPRANSEAPDTAVAELGIACEACHGPGSSHVERQSNPVTRYATHFGFAKATEVENPGAMRGHAGSEVCGQCHSASLFPDMVRWLGRGATYRAGAELLDDLRVVRHPLNEDQAWIDETLEADPDYLSGRFWADGMIRISGRDYNGYIESPCFADEEFSCMSCHQMHGADPDMQLSERGSDNRACLECHGEVGAELEAHTQHELSGPGSECVNCHMPHTVYGLTKAIRSHQISSPTVDESVVYGRPNACNICHLDRSLAWAAEALAQGWGVGAESSAAELAEADGGLASGLAWLVRGDAGQRALAAYYFGWGPAQETAGKGWMAPALIYALGDDYAAVRWVALRSLRSLPGFGETSWSQADAPGVAQSKGALAKQREVLMKSWSLGGEKGRGDLLMGESGFDVQSWVKAHGARDQGMIDLRE
jgi:predicted CXXCH cytochrome family protein